MKYLYPTTHLLLGLPWGGRRTQITCPKHTRHGRQERTPSFTVYPNGGFHCFGCGIHGQHGLDFLMRVFDKGYGESMDYLRSRGLLTGIPDVCRDEEYT